MKNVLVNLRELKMIDKKRVHKSVVDCTGQRFGGVVAIKYFGKNYNGAVWLCKCDCGSEIKRNRKSFVDNERLGQVTRCSRKCPAKNKQGE